MHHKALKPRTISNVYNRRFFHQAAYIIFPYANEILFTGLSKFIINRGEKEKATIFEFMHFSL